MTSFEQDVYAVLRRIPKGYVVTYQDIAQAIGRPNAVRAVGNALNKNPHAPKVPCHRVVKSDGKLGGYAGGQQKKIFLLNKEGVQVESGRVDLNTYRADLST